MAPMVTKKRDRPTESAIPSGKLLRADDLTPALKGRAAEVRGGLRGDALLTPSQGGWGQGGACSGECSGLQGGTGHAGAAAAP